MSKPRFDTMTEEGLRNFFAMVTEGKITIDKKEVNEVMELLKDPSRLPLLESLGAIERRIMMILHDFCGWSWTSMSWGKTYLENIAVVSEYPTDGYRQHHSVAERVEPLRVTLTPIAEDGEETLDLDLLGKLINKSHDWMVHNFKDHITSHRSVLVIELRRKRC